MLQPPQERYQPKPFVGSSHSWAIAALRHVSPDARVLDIGPGSGVMGRVLLDQGVTQLYAVEIDPEARKHVSPLYQAAVEKIDDLPGNQQFDVVLLLDVLEHMTDPHSFLKRVATLTKPGGKLLISVPNIAHWSVRLPLLFGRFQYAERGILDRTHFQFFTRKRLRGMISETTGLQIVELTASIEPVELLLRRFLWDNPLFRTLAHLRMKIAHYLPGLMAFQLLATVRKSS